MLSILERDGFDPAANLAWEEAVFRDARTWSRPLLLFYVNDPCVVLGRGNAEAQWVDRAACATDGVPVLRRFSGGGTVYHDHDNLNFSFIVPRKWLDGRLGGTRVIAGGKEPEVLPGGLQAAVRCVADFATGETPMPPQQTGIHGYISFFRQIAIRALSQGGPGYSESGVSDICLNGAKVSGNAQRIAAEVVLHHGTLMLRCPVEAIERYLPVPPNRPGVPHRGFVSGLAEQGRAHPREQIKRWIAGQFLAELGQ